jgi:phenylpropionate dioxygenase-like ring-hydroxylating dioxygenase large terminal subunit
MNDDALMERIKQQMRDEFARTGPPEGFPAFPDIPIERYTSDEFFELEMRHFWNKVWVMAGREEDIPNPGDYTTFDDLQAPVLLVRGTDGQVRAFYNSCQHRGAPVVRDPKGTARQLRCQYHSWTYEITHGTLVNVPDERDFINLCKEERGLKQLRCETWQGFVFVNQDPDAAPLQEWFGLPFAQLDQLQSATMRAVTTHTQIIPCNWKVTAEAFLEVYHFRTIHARGPAGYDTALDNRGAAMGLLPNGCSRMITPYSESACRAKGMKDWSDWRMDPIPGFADIPTVNGMIRCTSAAWSLFPNFVSPVGSHGHPVLLFWPLDKRTTKLTWTWFAPKDWEGDEIPAHWRRLDDYFNEIMDEDELNMAPMQRSLESPAMTGVPINYQERRIWHFHEQVDRSIGIERIPERMRVPQLLAPYVEREPVLAD